MVNKYWKEVNILVYETLDGVSRIQYKGHIIQTYGYDDNKPDLNITHFIIDEDSNDVDKKRTSHVIRYVSYHMPLTFMHLFIWRKYGAGISDITGMWLLFYTLVCCFFLFL